MVPGYGPGIAGQIIKGPTTPVCLPNAPCTKPVADATVLLLDPTSRKTVGAAVTNTSGDFIVSLPSGAYLVHVQPRGTPRCQEVQVTIEQNDFVLVQVVCDTGIR
jgi:hypothetical protein